MARGDVTNVECALIEPFLPVAATGPLPRRARDQFNGVMWRFRTGSPRQRLTDEEPAAFRRFHRAGHHPAPNDVNDLSPGAAGTPASCWRVCPEPASR
ncbi:hypothetical protein [Actinospica robiniae]|uniref:hypothetical protein n=1 Tax=Actinospica robiniae TaxID=304901 RepID=UPI000400FA7B|nr:hypothetical protein [Actinospica robiniae]